MVIVDCITLLVNNIFSQYNDQTSEQIDASLIEKKVASEISELVECINHIDASFIIVANEAGLGLVSANKMGRLYRDLLGKANQRLWHNLSACRSYCSAGGNLQLSLV